MHAVAGTQRGVDALAAMRQRCDDLAREVASHGPRSVPRELRRQHILACAHVLFIERSYDETSMVDVARMAGITKPVVYDQFASKEDLFAACMADSDEELAARTTAAVRTETDPRRRLYAAGYAYFEYVQERRLAWAKLLRTGAGPVREWEIRIRERQARDLAVRLSRERRVGGDDDQRTIDALAQMLTGAAEALAAWWTTQEDVTLEQIATMYADAMAPCTEVVLSA
jgi:AcrR family transcriptional regulator